MHRTLATCGTLTLFNSYILIITTNFSKKCFTWEMLRVKSSCVCLVIKHHDSLTKVKLMFEPITNKDQNSSYSVSKCSLFTETLFSLQSPSSARDKKQKSRIWWPPAQGSRVGKEKIDFNFISRTSHSFSHDRFACALADVFEKNENKNKTTSFYRLIKM